MKSLRCCLIGLAATVILILLDRGTKFLAVYYLKDQSAVELIPGVFELRYLENTGAAFGILQGKMWLFYILTIIVVALCAAVYVLMPAAVRFLPMRITIVLLISGAVGNFIDRITQQYVVDFLYFKLIDFPIFNVADIYVSCAAVLLILLVLFFYSEEDLKEMLP